MTNSTHVDDLRADGLGGIWASVTIHVPHADRPHVSNIININLHLPGAASLTFVEAIQRAEHDAHALLKDLAAKL
jgi:hypothetical protein